MKLTKEDAEVARGIAELWARLSTPLEVNDKPTKNKQILAFREEIKKQYERIKNEQSSSFTVKSTTNDN